MPTYDYRCSACDHEFELMQAMSAPVKKKCPSCAKLRLERLIGIGGGFFVKGKASAPPAEAKPTKTEAKVEPSVDKKADAKSDSSSDSKPDSKSTSTPVAKPTPKVEAPPREKKISGSTSTPTHKAREGRGVGNLIDKAKRLGTPATGPATKKHKGKK